MRRQSEAAFGLIETLVVVLIIVILLAIAIPLFLGARGRAKDRTARASLRTSLAAAKGIFTDVGSYTSVTVATLGRAEPALRFQAAVSTGPKVVRRNSATATDVLLSAQSGSPKCYFVTDSTQYGSGFAVSNGTCAAARAPVALTRRPVPGSVATASASGTRPTWASQW